MKFFVGLHRPNHAIRFERAFISINTIKNRKSGFPAKEWILDSGAFTTVKKYGGYPESVAVYASLIRRFKDNGTLLAAVSQDYMCEPIMLAKTGLTVADHQRLTIERYDALMAEDTGALIMPALQGYSVPEYLSCLAQYGKRLSLGAWVGVGSICKRNGNASAIEQLLLAIKKERPDLRLHGFGLKATALNSAIVTDCLYSADSMAWSFAARMRGGGQNDWREAAKFVRRIETRGVQLCYNEFH